MCFLFWIIYFFKSITTHKWYTGMLLNCRNFENFEKLGKRKISNLIKRYVLKKCNKLIDLSSCQNFEFSNPYIFAIWLFKPLIFQISKVEDIGLLRYRD